MDFNEYEYNSDYNDEDDLNDEIKRIVPDTSAIIEGNVEKIINGTKKFEYRRRLAKEDVSIIYIYSSAPSMKVVASVQIIGRLSASPTSLWEQTKANAGISRAKYREYFRGCKTAYAYQLGNVKVFEEAKPLSEYGITIAPQSFVYIDVKKDDK